MLLATPAVALDADQDGYHANSAPNDCDDGNAARHPNRTENVGDGVDQDCDGTDALSRALVFGNFSSPAWTATGGATLGGDTASISSAGGAFSRSFNVFDARGAAHIAFKVLAYSGNGSCTANVETLPPGGGTPMNASWAFSGVGIKVSPALAVHAAPRAWTGAKIVCPAGISLTIDWIVQQNAAPYAVGPASDAIVAWEDIEAPGGGLTTTMAQVVSTRDTSGVWLLDDVYASSDVGGVAKADAYGNWTTINGTGATGLTTQADLAVWGLPPSATGTLYALTGREGTYYYHGGFWYSTDSGANWYKAANSMDDDVGGLSRQSTCGGSDKPYSGGKLLVEEPEPFDVPEIVYIGNGDPDVSQPVWMFDGTEVCELPGGETALPEGALVRALERGYDTSGAPVLLVGYAGREMVGSAELPSVYACALPTDTDLVDLECGGTEEVTCVPISGSEGLDVRDIEIDPSDPTRYVVADGGDDPDAGVCTDGVGGIYYGDLDGLNTISEVPNSWDVTMDQELTGVSFYPDGSRLFAFMPLTHDNAYAFDRVYVIETSDFYAFTDSWVPMNTDEGDSGDRELVFWDEYPDAAWLSDEEEDTGTDDMVTKRDPFAYTRTPGHSVDAVWSEVTEWVNPIGYFSSTFNFWGVHEHAYWAGTDAQWGFAFAPDPDNTNPLTYQTAVITDIAMDPTGDVWASAADIGLFQYPYGYETAEVDCLWDYYNAGGRAVSVGTDGSVWIGLYDQDGSTDTHEMGVFRTLDGGDTWMYEGAGYSGNRYVDGGLARAICKDGDSLHRAEPMASGSAFSVAASTSLLSDTNGNLYDLAAIDENTALVLFETTSTTGGLHYTIDGGATWHPVAFIPGTSGCVESDFFNTTRGMSVIGAGTTSLVTDSDLDGVLDAAEGQLQVLVSSKYDVSGNNCALARVTITSGTPTWTWFTLGEPTNDTTVQCRIDDQHVAGVIASPWTPTEAFVWGTYSYFAAAAGKHRGGVCAVDLTSGATTEILSPVDHQFAIGSVSAAPSTIDSLFIAPKVDVDTMTECYETSASGCDLATPFFADRTGTTWWPVPLATYPPNLVGTAAGWGEDPTSGLPVLLYGTEGSGGWIGTMSW
ncbi:MAG: MopE-related protein [Pseudomonadota bacterium]|nr:MopE-related protein [Pseudomonadota bacterium]